MDNKNITLEVKKNQSWKGVNFNANFQIEYIYLLKIHVITDNLNTLLQITYPAFGIDCQVASFILNKKENDLEFIFTPFSNSQNLEFRMSTFQGYSTGKLNITIKDVLNIKTDIIGSELQNSIKLIGPWFHQLNLKGVKTRDISKIILKSPQSDYFGDKENHNHPEWIWNQFKNFVDKNLENKQVLDIACNDGFYSIEFARRGASVVGIDNWFPCIVRSTFVKKVLNIKNISFRHLDVNDLSKAFNKQFDIILCLGLLYHLQDPQKTINEIAKLTKIAYFETLSNKNVQEPILIEDKEIAPVGYVPTINWLLNAFKKAGFTKIIHINPGFPRAVFKVMKN